MEDQEEYIVVNETTGETKRKRTKTNIKRPGNWGSKRKLRQYASMTDDEFEEAMAQKEAGIAINKMFEARIKRKIDQLKEQYDFSDLKPNDWNLVRSLAQCEIDLEDIQLKMYNSRNEEEWDIIAYQTMSKMRNDLVKTISDIQNDLQITRKVRKNDQETSVINFIDDLKKRNKKFLATKRKKIICPKCHRMIATLWGLDLTGSKTYFQYQCQVVLEDGKRCGEIIKFTGKELADMESSNLPELLPVTLR